MLSSEDIDLLREFEDQNSTTRILMHDPDKEGHWRRCVEHKEPMDRSQFNSARSMYYEMAEKYGFTLKTLWDFNDSSASSSSKDMVSEVRKLETREQQKSASAVKSNLSIIETKNRELGLTQEQLRLHQANAIDEVLSKRIVKSKGDTYDVIESKIRIFLNQELGILLGTDKPKVEQTKLPFSQDEINFLKVLINKAKEKK